MRTGTDSGWRRKGLGVFLMVVLGAACPAEAGWQTFVPADGLIASNVQSVFEDSNGNLWFGAASGGACRYDGRNWSNLTGEEGLHLDRVSDILEDQNGRMWFTSQTGPPTGYSVAGFDGEGWEYFSWNNELPHFMVTGMMEDDSGDLWFATVGGVARFDGNTWETYRTEDGLADNWVHCLMEDSQGAFWFGTSSGVSRFDGTTWSTLTTAEGLGEDGIYAIHEDRSGNLWFAGRAVSRFDGDTWTVFSEPVDYHPGASFTEIAEDDMGYLWFAVCEHGVLRYDGVVWTRFGLDDGLPNTCPMDITVDTRGNVWIATPAGAARFDADSWDYVTPNGGITSHRIHDILEASPGSVWIATLDGLNLYEQGTGTTFTDQPAITTYTTRDGLISDYILSLELDQQGSLWVGTQAGVSVFDGSVWTSYPAVGVVDVFQSRSGDMWLAMDGSGLIRIRDSVWETFDESDGLPTLHFTAVAEDDLSRIWVAGLSYGVGRFDGNSWTWWTEAEGLASTAVVDLVVAGDGDVWVATTLGVSRFDGENWMTYTSVDGLAADYVSTLYEDTEGNIWCGTGVGVSRFDGEFWTTITESDGLLLGGIAAITQDSRGRIWVGGAYSGPGDDLGVSIYSVDRVPPKTLFYPEPAGISASRRHTLTFEAAYRETRGIEFSYSLDRSAWSSPSPSAFWTIDGLGDGSHVFSVRSRDRLGNVDPYPASVTIEIDATPPVPVLHSPAAGEVVRGSCPVQGTADDARLDLYRLLARPSGAADWGSPPATVLAESDTPLSEATLASWDTTLFPDGSYELRLEVADTLGLTGAALATVVVDNEAPWAEETSPAKVAVSSGGDVFTTNGKVHLYFVPRAFSEEASVVIAAVEDGSVPDTLSSGAVNVSPGYDISWEGVTLAKPATLEMALGGKWGQVPISREEGDRHLLQEPEIGVSPLVPALYLTVDGQNWQRVGGTIDATTGIISAAITREGRYSLFADDGAVGVGEGLTSISFSPRVFSPTGAFAKNDVSISFSLSRSGPVSVKIYNRAGRLVSEIIEGKSLSAGANLVRWDGRDRGGSIVPDGLYLVSVEALGEKQVKTLAVVR